MKNEVVAHIDPKSPISEIFRTLRTNIQFINSDQKTKTLLVTSTLPGEGKSWITSNLAVTFAQAGKKVVLIDADMRKGRQYAIFGVSPKPGLSNFLSQIGIKENQNINKEIIACMQKTEIKNLYLIPAGSIPQNPSELLVSAKMIDLLEKLKNVCDIVIIDGTPCELVTDAVILSRMVDSTIIVTAHKVTKKDALERVIKNINNVGGKITGVVVNKLPVSTKRYEERYYYYGSEPSLENRITSTLKPATIKKENTIEEQEEALKEIKKRTTKTTKTPTKTGTKTRSKTAKTSQEAPKSEEKQSQKTEDILKQMNEYLDKEKAKKKKGEKND